MFPVIINADVFSNYVVLFPYIFCGMNGINVNKGCQHCIKMQSEHLQIPLTNNTWAVSKQMGRIYAVPIHTSRYILSNVM